MAQPAPLYDLVLLLAPGATDQQRAKVLADVEKSITGAGGAVERNDDWGTRPTAFQINHQPEAEYHLLQFKSPPSLIEELSHTLRITDGVVRFRVIKNLPGTPEAPSSPPPVVATATASPTPAPPRVADHEAAPEPAAAEAAEPEAPAAAEPEAAEPETASEAAAEPEAATAEAGADS